MQEIAIVKNDLPRVVIIGAGFAGINLIKTLQHNPVQMILLDQHNHHQFQPLLYQVAISGLEPDSVVTPVRKLFKSCINMIYRMAKVESIDKLNKRVITDIGFVRYDYLVIATGSRTNYYGSKEIEPVTGCQEDWRLPGRQTICPAPVYPAAIFGKKYPSPLV